MDVASESWQDNLNHLPIDETTSRTGCTNRVCHREPSLGG
jgi:hypothetical protein